MLWAMKPAYTFFANCLTWSLRHAMWETHIIVYGAYLLTLYLLFFSDISLVFYLTCFLANILWHSFCHSIWHLFWVAAWHAFWHSFGYSIWLSVWNLSWHSFWRLFWHSILFGILPGICSGSIQPFQAGSDSGILSWSFSHCFNQSTWHPLWHAFGSGPSPSIAFSARNIAWIGSCHFLPTVAMSCRSRRCICAKIEINLETLTCE